MQRNRPLIVLTAQISLLHYGISGVRRSVFYSSVSGQLTNCAGHRSSKDIFDAEASYKSEVMAESSVIDLSASLRLLIFEEASSEYASGEQQMLAMKPRADNACNVA